MAKSIEYGIRTPKSDFEKRANDTNAPAKVGKVGKKSPHGGVSSAKQTKGFGASRS